MTVVIALEVLNVLLMAIASAIGLWYVYAREHD